MPWAGECLKLCRALFWIGCPGIQRCLNEAPRQEDITTVTDEEVLAEFRAADALLEGHFILSSGLRSPRYLQCARVLMNPARGARLAEALGTDETPLPD